MSRCRWVTSFAFLAAGWAILAGNSTAAESHATVELTQEEVAYREAIARRAERIVDALRLEDEQLKQRVSLLVAKQYRALRDIHDQRDESVSALAKHDNAIDREGQIEELKAAADRAVVTRHRAFVAMLEAELSPELVGQIKDGMTYGVVPITYNAYLALLPDLMDEEKRYTKACLLEAREYAMDGGSSDEKHAWFGKYKGRINNYLSARGYDLKQAEKDLARRKKEEAEQ